MIDNREQRYFKITAVVLLFKIKKAEGLTSA